MKLRALASGSDFVPRKLHSAKVVVLAEVRTHLQGTALAAPSEIEETAISKAAIETRTVIFSRYWIALDPFL